MKRLQSFLDDEDLDWQSLVCPFDERRILPYEAHCWPCLRTLVSQRTQKTSVASFLLVAHAACCSLGFARSWAWVLKIEK